MKIYPTDFYSINVEDRGGVMVTLIEKPWGLVCRPEYKCLVIVTGTAGWIIEIWFFRSKKEIERFKKQLSENTEIIWEGIVENEKEKGGIKWMKKKKQLNS